MFVVLLTGILFVFVFFPLVMMPVFEKMFDDVGLILPLPSRIALNHSLIWLTIGLIAFVGYLLNEIYGRLDRGKVRIGLFVWLLITFLFMVVAVYYPMVDISGGDIP